MYGGGEERVVAADGHVEQRQGDIVGQGIESESVNDFTKY